MAEDFLTREAKSQEIYLLSADRSSSTVNKYFPWLRGPFGTYVTSHVQRFSPILKYSNIVKTARPPLTYYPLKIYRKIYPIEQLKPEVNHVSLAFFEFVNSDS